MRKYLQYAVFAVSLLVCLSGCGKTERDWSVTNIATDSTSAPASTPVVESVGPETYSPTTPNEVKTQHLYQVFDDNVRVNAEVILPEKETYSTYNLRMVDCDPERLFGIFCPEGYGSYTLDERSSSTRRYFESSGKKLVVRQNSISYSAYNIDWGENLMQDVKTLMYYFTQVQSQNESHDLSFMTVAEMEEFCNNIFNQLGITFEPKLERCITLTGQEIMDFQHELFEGIYNNPEMGRTPTSLTSATDTCYLEFSFTYDGLPLLGSAEPGVTSAVSMMPTPSVTATIMINADGLQNCEVYFPCIVESESQPQAILTPNEAVAKLKEKYDLEIHTSAEEFTNAWLEYIPIVTDDSVTLTPYWCFVTQNAREENPNAISNGQPEFANAQRFNAITGKDLTYGG